jgi:hypothetical protein
MKMTLTCNINDNSTKLICTHRVDPVLSLRLENYMTGTETVKTFTLFTVYVCSIIKLESI